MKVFVIDLARCNGCHNCQIACKDEHCGNAWPPYAAPQPDVGHFWCKVEQEERGQTPKVRVAYRPVLCGHCERCALEELAPDAVARTADGLVYLDPAAAKGRRDLADACPMGCVYYNDELDIPQKCTGCAHLVAEGEPPHCVDLCATEALRFGEEEDFDLAGAEVDERLDGRGPRVYYLNAPRLFMGGEVWDPVDDEVIEGARITLAGPAGLQRETRTDGFGDFWFERLDAGEYRVRIEADGFEAAERDVTLDKSLNLGDFPLARV